DPNVSTSDRSVNQHIFGSLVVRNLYDGQYSPHLAESWEILNPKTWKFNLRKGVKFHNGQEVTSADVKFSFERSMGLFNRKFKGYRKGALKRLIASIETPDDYTVIIKTKFADASFLGVPMLLQVVPKAYVEELGDQKYAKNPVGFGPLKVKEIKVGEYLSLERFEDYWNIRPKPGEVRRSRIKTIVLKTLPQQATMVAALKAGEADAMIGVQTDTSKELEKLSNITVYYAPGALHGFFIINFRAEKNPKTGEPNPLRDVRVRQALNYALNIDDIIKNYLTGHEWRTTLIGRTQIGYDPNAPIYPYDPEKARKLLAEAGYAKGVSIPFHYVETSRGPYLDALWEYWRAVGIKIVPQPHSAAVNLRGVYTKKSYGIISWGGGYGPDPGNWFRVMVPYNGLQAMHLPHPKVEALAKKQSVEFDPKKRAELIKELNEILLKEAWFIPTIRGVSISALNTDNWMLDHAKMPLSSFPLTYIMKKK
ncbi:MAG: ABC transporter substrate-binding protein, partial [Deltaproteobacteria bacterium]|nr:ABC transporter substrate-binding protein [Deltaproteobacteria bacterium]